MFGWPQLHLDAAPVEKEPKEREVDWFAEHGDLRTYTCEHAPAQVTPRPTQGCLLILAA